MNIPIREITARHPCFSFGKPNNKGRIHLPVSPGCNIECKFCDRKINDTEQRPGVTSQIITPQQAVEVVRKSVAVMPEIEVVGIAGPGDTLQTPYALETFRLINKEFPNLIKCMSTNGLLLDDKADEVIEVGINTITVTINDVYPETLSDICGRVRYHGNVYEGEEAGALLISKQIAGIRRVAQSGMIVKVNTVFVPKINSGHIEKIAQTVKEAGASLYNIIPLIPVISQRNQGWSNKIALCTCTEIDSARSKAEKHIQVFRHCQHCRADAIGIPGGKDYGEQIYQKRIIHENTFSHG
ncbi:MAG: radical SAM protein [Planctomycetaceae bacterium]|jgi:nitrogen fixation protein NifB|nr:radical SAM protein [Planctomycetaceae bacterium]